MSVVPFAYTMNPDGSVECEESSLCTWSDTNRTRPIPYCLVHQEECPPDLFGCYTDSTCGGNVLPFNPQDPPIVLPQPEEIEPSRTHSIRKILILGGIICIGVLFVIIVLLILFRIL